MVFVRGPTMGEGMTPEQRLQAKKADILQLAAKHGVYNVCLFGAAIALLHYYIAGNL